MPWGCGGQPVSSPKRPSILLKWLFCSVGGMRNSEACVPISTFTVVMLTLPNTINYSIMTFDFGMPSTCPKKKNKYVLNKMPWIRGAELFFLFQGESLGFTYYMLMQPSLQNLLSFLYPRANWQFRIHWGFFARIISSFRPLNLGRIFYSRQAIKIFTAIKSFQFSDEIKVDQTTCQVSCHKQNWHPSLNQPKLYYILMCC